MKRNDNGDFCVLYVEPADAKSELLQALQGLNKPVVIILAEQSSAFQRPEDFSTLKHAKRQLDLPIVFVMPAGGKLAQLAARQGFPVYLSMDDLAAALSAGQLSRHRTLTRNLDQNAQRSGELSPVLTSESVKPRQPATARTAPLPSTKPVAAPKRTIPLSDENNAPVHAEPPPRKAPTTYAADDDLYEHLRDFTYRQTVPLQQPLITTQEVPLPPDQKRPGRFIKVLLIMAIFAVTLAGVASFFIFSQKLPVTSTAKPSVALPASVGRVAFLSSNQLSQNSSQGIADRVLVDLSNIPAAAPQKNYYAWLLGDKSQGDGKSLLLGPLQVNSGRAHLLYNGDGQHTNLLMLYSRFLVTQEDATVTPISPTPDFAAWRFYGEISQVPINSPANVKHYSFLDHLRHLLAADPAMEEMELPGGLNTWLDRNASTVQDSATSMRAPWEDNRDTAFVRKQAATLLAYLDGISYVQRDVPTSMLPMLNDRLARIGLLQVGGPNQDPPGYINHVISHLSGLLQSPGATPQLRTTAAGIVTALNNVDFWLTQLRHDAQNIMKMSDAQLRNYATLTTINDMIDNAQNAYVGQQDPATGQMRQGINWIHDQVQRLAALNVTIYTGGNSPIQNAKNA
jgi:hypothetical protein